MAELEKSRFEAWGTSDSSPWKLVAALLSLPGTQESPGG